MWRLGQTLGILRFLLSLRDKGNFIVLYDDRFVFSCSWCLGSFFLWLAWSVCRFVPNLLFNINLFCFVLFGFYFLHKSLITQKYMYFTPVFMVCFEIAFISFFFSLFLWSISQIELIKGITSLHSSTVRMTQDVYFMSCYFFSASSLLHDLH